MTAVVFCLALVATWNEARAEAAAMTDLTPANEDVPLAEDLTARCLVNGKASIGNVRDGNMRTLWESDLHGGAHQLLIEPPVGERAGGLVIRWRKKPMATHIQVMDEAGEWQTVAQGADDFLAQYIPLPDIAAPFRVISAESEKQTLQIYEITVLSPGRLPDWVQVWQKPEGKVDLMLLATHPDDELLWFGGLLPTYAGEEGKRVLVVTAACKAHYRKQELLDGLWHCGVRLYPVFLGLEDVMKGDRAAVLKAWGKDETIQRVAALYCEHQPDVVVLQDAHGEYGHSAHQAFSYAGRKAIPLAAGEGDSEWRGEYAPWKVPKVYIHLWEENQLRLNWETPLSAFGGKTALAVADEALHCHASQTDNGWSMERAEEWDNSLFGLYAATVGPDVAKDDLFEHIE